MIDHAGQDKDLESFLKYNGKLWRALRWKATRPSLHCKGPPGLPFGECLKGSRGEAAVEALVRLALLDGAAPRGAAALPIL